jgi:hypothetical protein
VPGGFAPPPGPARPGAESERSGGSTPAALVRRVLVPPLVRLEPLASASPEELVAAIGPTVQRYPTGAVELPGS